MKTYVKFLATAAVGVCCLPAFADSITSAVTESGVNGDSGLNGGIVVFTSGDGFDFTSQNYLGLASIDSLSLTLTVDDGDSAFGEYDYNKLTLALDGIDTGLKLNGFADSQNLTLTFTGPNNSAGLLAALQTDGKLVGAIKDATPNGNIFFFPRIDTTLTLTGTPVGTIVPEPGAVATGFALFGGISLGLFKARRKK